MNLKVLLAAPLVAYLVVANASDLRRPANWSSSSTGDGPSAYEIGVDDEVLYQGHRSLTVRGSRQSDTAYANAMQYVSTKGYEGKKVRFSGVLRSSGVDTWAGIWLRSDVHGRDLGDSVLPPAMGFTHSVAQWTPVSVVIEVGRDQSQITLALALVGNGQAWLSDLKFEMVDDTTPVTTTRVALDVEKRKARLAEMRARSANAPDRAMPANLALSTE